MGNNKSKNKGTQFEREICDSLKKTFNLPFIRVFSSGAYTGGKNIHRKKTLDENQIMINDGDISPPMQLKNMKIECKFYKEFSFHKLYDESYSIIDGWINQSESLDKICFLIFKINRRGIFVLYKNIYKFIVNNHSSYKDYIVARYDKFFERNKDALLDLCK